MSWNDLLRQHKIKIEPLRQSESSLLFHVKNGQNKLAYQFASQSTSRAEKLAGQESNAVLALCLDGIPLTRLHSDDEFFCPTCQKLVSAGYGMDKCGPTPLDELSAALNANFISLDHSFALLQPLLGLLGSGYYSLSVCELMPTDGNGNFFWTVNNTPALNLATCPVWEARDLRMSTPEPRYMLPSQPPTRLNHGRVAYYANRPSAYGLAYYAHEGYISTLLDGHHKATAAALAGRMLRCLVITPHYFKGRPSAPKGQQY